MKKKQIKIGFQGWFLNKPYTGIGQHSIGLLRALANEKNVSCIVPVPSLREINTNTITGIPKKWLMQIKPKWWLPHRALKRWYWEAVQVPGFFAEQKLDFEYYPYPSAIPKYSQNLRSVTVHDMISWEDDRYKGNKIKTLYHSCTKKSLVYADQIFTVSKYTWEKLGQPTAKVLYNGAPEIPKNIPKSKYPNALVYLGGYDIRKNIPALVKAFWSVQKKYPKMQLILIGEAHHNSKLYPDFNTTSGTIRVGGLSDANVYALLKEAFAFVHFSDEEGFNIPLLQALSMGTPSIVADIPVNREVAGNTAFFVDSQKESGLLAIIEKLQDDDVRNRIAREAKSIAKKYSWGKTAKTLLKTINSVRKTDNHGET